MKIASVITSVGYGDFLTATLPTNRGQFHYSVVATTADDLVTRKVCEFWNVDCVVTDRFRDGGGFRKGAGINDALARLKAVGMADGWVVHMDADIFLPPLAGEHIGRANLDPAMLYGIDRMMVRSFEDWWKFLSFPRLQHECRAYVHPTAFPLGTRIASPTPGYDGYVPIGFFQMWNPTVSGVTRYPEEHTDAGRGDMLFTKAWPRSKRAMIPEVIGYHLESAANQPMGVNWKGRVTPHFGPCPELPPSPPPPPAPKPCPSPTPDPYHAPTS